MIPKPYDNYDHASCVVVQLNNSHDFDTNHRIPHAPQHDPIEWNHPFHNSKDHCFIESSWEAPVSTVVRKHVSFAPMTELYPSRWSSEEIESSWYTKDELAHFKDDRRALVSALKRVRFDVSRIDTTVHELRGYEAYLSIETNKAYKRHRVAVVKAVLTEQARQRYFQIQNDVTQLQQVSQQASQWATSIATQQAVQDAQYVFQLFLTTMQEQQQQQQQQQQLEHQEQQAADDDDMDMELTALERGDEDDDDCDFDCEPLPMDSNMMEEDTMMVPTTEFTTNSISSLPQVSWHSSNHSHTTYDSSLDYSLGSIHSKCPSSTNNNNKRKACPIPRQASNDTYADFSLNSISSRAPMPRSSSAGSRRYSAPAMQSVIHNNTSSTKPNTLLTYSNHNNLQQQRHSYHEQPQSASSLPLTMVVCVDEHIAEEEDISSSSFC